jgi:single-strand DNA-binding protein
LGKHVPQTADKPKETEPNTMFNKIILIGRLGQNVEAKTAQNNKEYVVLNIATQESWKNDKGEYETRTEWHRVFAWSNLSKFAKTLQKGQPVTLEGTLRYREV